MGAPDFPRRPLADTFLYRALVRVNDYKCANFQRSSSINFRDKEGVPKFNVGATIAPCRTSYAETFMCAQSTWLGQTACGIVSLCIMQLWEYIFPIGLPLYVPKNGVLGGFESEDVKILSSDPQKALSCMNTRPLIYRVTKSVQRPEL